MEWLALLIGIGVISSLLDKKPNSPSSAIKTVKPKQTPTPRKLNEWDGEIHGKGIASGSSWDQIRKTVFTRDNYTCRSCGRKNNLTVDHIVQLSRGGSNNLENLQTLCRHCHEQKDNKKIFDKSFNHHGNYGSQANPSTVVQSVERAINTKARIKIAYTDIKGKVTYRDITPSHFTKEHGIPYVVAFCHLRNDKRTFRLSRMKVLS